MSKIDTSKPPVHKLTQSDKEAIFKQDDECAEQHDRTRAKNLCIMYAEAKDCDGQEDAFKALLDHYGEVHYARHGVYCSGTELMEGAGL
jgi:hypothetical protein